MAFPEKDAIIAQLFRSLGAPVGFIDVFDATMDAVKTEAHAITTFLQSTAKSNQSATRRPGHDWLVSEYFRLPTLDGAAECDPGSYFVAAGTSLGIDLIMRVFG
jgi:hypothetical protein